MIADVIRLTPQEVANTVRILPGSTESPLVGFPKRGQTMARDA
jgi:hypothetical protein